MPCPFGIQTPDVNRYDGDPQKHIKNTETSGGMTGCLGIMIFWVVVSNIFYVYPYLGKMSNLTNIFQRGWNDQQVLKVDKMATSC